VSDAQFRAILWAIAIAAGWVVWVVVLMTGRRSDKPDTMRTWSGVWMIFLLLALTAAMQQLGIEVSKALR